MNVARTHLWTAALAYASGRHHLGAYWVKVAAIALDDFGDCHAEAETRMPLRGGA
jgi:hypothetical protein